MRGRAAELDRGQRATLDLRRDAIRVVASAPGAVILPGEFAKAKVLIAAGTAVDYQGAAGDLAFDENGDVSGTFEHWAVLNGAITTVEMLE